MPEQEQISDLKSLWPKSQEMLARAGIDTIEQLRELGSVEAYIRVKRVWAGTSLNLLWALESALTDMPWRQVAKIHRTSLLLAVDEAERRSRS